MPVQVIPGELTPFTIVIAVLSGIILFYGYLSMFIKERLFLSEACKCTQRTFWTPLTSCWLVVALIVGIIAGPLVADGFNPYNWPGTDEITKELTRCVIAIQVWLSFHMVCYVLTLSCFFLIGYGRWYWTPKVSQEKHKQRCPLTWISFWRHYLKKEWRTMFMFLVPIMIFMWLISGLFIWALIPPLDYVRLPIKGYI